MAISCREKATKPSCFEGLTGRVLVFSVSHISSGASIEWAASKKCSGAFLINTLGDESLKTIAKVINRYRLPNDIVILSIHWGSNKGLAVYESHKAYAHALIDEANVDILMAIHPTTLGQLKFIKIDQSFYVE